MAIQHDDLFIFDTEEVDVKEMMKIRIPMIQNDTPILKFRVYNYGEPIDLADYHWEFRGFLPNGELYSEEDNITVSGNEMTIVCDKTVTQAVGEAICSLRIWDSSYKQKSTYQIILRVKSVSSYAEDNKVSYSTISVLERLDEAICRAIDLKIELNETIALAEETDENLKTTIAEANKSREDLQITINSSNNINTTLTETITKGEETNTKIQNSITEANNINTTLDDKIVLADNSKTELETSINDSIVKKNELESTITIAESQIEELKNFDSTGVVERTNEMYDKLIPQYDLITIEHGLNCYPLVQFISTVDGYGMGGYGETIYGSSLECNLGNYETEYVDKNKIKIIVSEEYNLTNPVLSKVNDYEYSITSPDSQNSINIKLIDNEGFDKINDMKYEDATGTDENISLNLHEPLTHGYFKKFIANANSGGRAITINGKYPLYKPCSTNPPIIKTGRPYEIYYDAISNCFFLKASATGTVSANYVLAGQTYSTENDTDLVGTMVDKRNTVIGSSGSDAFTVSKSICSGTDTNNYVGAFDLNLPVGYYGGLNRIHIPNLLPKNFLKGVKIGWDGNYIEGSIYQRSEYTNALSYYVDTTSLYARIPTGAYLFTTTSGYPEVRCSLDDVSTALKSLDDNTKDSFVETMGGVAHATDKSFVYCSPRITLPEQNDRTNTTIIDIPFEPSIIIGKSRSEADHAYYNGTKNQYTISTGNGFYIKTLDSTYPIDKQIRTDEGTRTQIRSITYSNGKLTIYSSGSYGGSNLNYAFMIIAYK